MPLTDMSVYLTGPEPRFDWAAEELRARGARVHPPIGSHPRDDLDLVVENLKPIFVSDVVALLPGWEGCGRAAVVRTIAGSHRIPVVRVEELFLVS